MRNLSALAFPFFRDHPRVLSMISAFNALQRACAISTCSLLLVLVAPAIAAAQDKSVRPGINDSFKDPKVGQFLERFEAEGREIYELREEIVKAAGIKSGMEVADVGAGTGLFTRLFAKQVGSEGKVYAVDIAQNFLDHIAQTCKEAEITNVDPILCSQDDARLPPESVDVIFICDTYHHFEFPQKTLASLHKALRPGGQIVLIDFHRIEGQSSEFIMGHVRAGKEVFSQEVQEAGFKLVSEETELLKDNYFIRFEKAK